MERDKKKLEWVDPELVKLSQTLTTLNGFTICDFGSSFESEP